MSEPFDLDALEHEANGEPFTFRFGGEVYSLPASPDLRAIASLEAQRLDDALLRLLGEEQYGRLMASPATFDAPTFETLLEAYREHLGVAPGNSSASTGSSVTTPAPLRPTSPATTRSA